MTRETKIGLLVGLAFTIVVAMLLSLYATDSTNPSNAGLSEAGANVRQSVTTPAAPPAATPSNDTPRAPVPTRADLLPKDPAGTGGSPGAGSPVSPKADGGPALPPIAPSNGTGKPNSAGDLAKQFPGDLEHVGGADGTRTSTPGVGTAGKPGTPPVTPPKTYVAEPGDSVSKIARKMMGGDTKTNREALVKANANLQGDGAMVYAGRSYVIPSAGAAAQVADVPATPVKPSTTPPATSAPAGTTWYTVKDNDNLWRIAAHELGDGNLWSQIRDLNKDVLKGGETVRANMRIRLPKPSATASVN